MKKKLNTLTEKAMKNIGIVTVSVIVLIVASVLVSAGMDWLIDNVSMFEDLYYGSMVCEYTVGGIAAITAYKVMVSLRKRTFAVTK